MDPNDPTLRCPTEDDDDDEGGSVEELNDEGLLASAEACTKRGKGTLRPTRGGRLPLSPCAL